jgi:hypothetical protein
MNDTTVIAVQAKWVEKLPPLRLGRCSFLLSAAMLLFFVPVAAISYALHGPDALQACTVAVVVCWTGSSLALIATAKFGRQGATAPLYTVLFGLVFNGAFPFSVGLILNHGGGALADAGVFGLIVIFLQIALLVETLLALCLIKSPR